ncbi:MAG: DNA repair protein RecN [Acidimicrobiia bacterium]
MLTELHIEQLGVIDQLDLVLGRGLTALTGETGAGKTMLVEAISLLVGGRAEGTLVRPGAGEARVEGRFVLGDDEVVLARVIPADGRSRAYVNGRLATVANLAEEGSRLVDLHGQHSHQSLLSGIAQRGALDRFGAVDLTLLRAARARLTEIEATLAALGGDARARAREIDLLRFQVGELAAAAITGPDEEEQLAQDEELLADAVAHREAALRAIDALTADGGAADALGVAIASITGRAPFDEAVVRLRSLATELADAGAELRTRAESIEEDPERLAVLRARRQLLHELRRKYGDTLADVLDYQRESAIRLDELEGYEARAATLDGERAAALRAVDDAAAAVGAARRRAAPKLAAAVAGHLGELAMKKARVEILVGEDPGDDVTFLLGANPGEPALPLTKVASGGELARSMLALRLVLTEAPDTLVFDEVDAGIGGAAAIAVGRALARLGERHQVLVVTHLPQVAALASTQVVVTKQVVKGRTTAGAHVVDGAARVDELSRMLSGRADSETARQHALELLGGPQAGGRDGGG